MTKRRIRSLIFIVLTIVFFGFVSMEAKDLSKIIIKTSSVQCGMCKKTIEKALEDVEGVEESNVKYKKKYTIVKFDPDLTSPEKIREAISKAGYQADDVKANKEAYDKLHHCCKLPEDQGK